LVMHSVGISVLCIQTCAEVNKGIKKIYITSWYWKGNKSNIIICMLCETSQCYQLINWRTMAAELQGFNTTNSKFHHWTWSWTSSIHLLSSPYISLKSIIPPPSWCSKFFMLHCLPHATHISNYSLLYFTILAILGDP
jgi:hypothetical protein